MRDVSVSEPRRFRWRLTVAFVAVAAFAAGVLAFGSYVLVRKDRVGSFTDRSLEKANLAVSIAEGRIVGQADEEEIEDVIATLQKRAGIVAVAVMGDRSIGSGPTGEPTSQVPMEVLDAPADRGFQRHLTDIDGTPYLIVHPVDDPEPAQLLLYFSMGSLVGQMDRLSTILWQLWGAVAIAAALIGNILARRTLRPVAHASRAATALAEGLLDTRLPIDRHDEFGSWAISFNQMADALQEKIHQLTESAEREKQFTSDVAHELRTPLSALVSATALLRDRFAEMDAEARWAAQQVLDQVARLRRLVEELLEISRLDAGREPVTFTRVELDDLVRRLVGHRGWERRVRIELPGIDFTTDVRRFDRVLGNLVSNALEHGGGTVEIKGRVDNGQIVIDVSDEGPGIDPSDAAHVFDRFFKGDPARGGGSGLGLAIARENARLLGGEIGLVSAPPGATFTVRIPRDPDAGEERDGLVTGR